MQEKKVDDMQLEIKISMYKNIVSTPVCLGLPMKFFWFKYDVIFCKEHKKNYKKYWDS